MRAAAERALLEPCPHCGVLLTRALVAAVRDSGRAEACPTVKPARTVSEADLASKRLMAYMMLGRLAGVTR